MTARRLISLDAHRRITRPLIRIDGSYDRAKITAYARAERRFGLTWSDAMRRAWALAKRQRALVSTQMLPAAA